MDLIHANIDPFIERLVQGLLKGCFAVADWRSVIHLRNSV